VHQPFVDFKRTHVAVVEHRIGADLDVIGTRRRVRDDAVGLKHPDGFFGLAKHLVQPRLQQVHGIFGGEGFRFVLERATVVDVVQVIGHHQPQVGQRRVARMKRIGRGAIQLLRDQPEVFGAARFEHAHHHAVFLAHAAHDLPDRVELAQLAGDVALDVLEFELHGARIEGQRPPQVIIPIHRRHLFTLGLEKALTDAVVPLHRIQHADRGLGQHDAV
jgi:hypothetical protein